MFSAGEYQFANLPLGRILTEVEPYPTDYQFHFFDGIAHGRDWSGKSIKAQSEEIIVTVPPVFHERLLNGFIMFKLVAAKGDIEQLNSSIIDFEGLFNPTDFRDGVWVGFQRSVGHLKGRALEKPQSLRRNYQHAVVEELGWRVGEDFLANF